MAPQKATPTFVTQPSPGGRTRVVDACVAPEPSLLKPDSSKLYMGVGEFRRSAAFSAEERERLRNARDVALGLAPPPPPVQAVVPEAATPQRAPGSPRGGARGGGSGAIRRGPRAAPAKVAAPQPQRQEPTASPPSRRQQKAALLRAATADATSPPKPIASHAAAPPQPLPSPSPYARSAEAITAEADDADYDACCEAPAELAADAFYGLGIAQPAAFADHAGTFSLFSADAHYRAVVRPSEAPAHAAPAAAMTADAMPLYSPWGAPSEAGWEWRQQLGARERAAADAADAQQRALWEPPPPLSADSIAAARAASAAALAAPPPPPLPQYAATSAQPQQLLKRATPPAVDVEAARAAARAALSPRTPPPLATQQQQLQQGYAPATQQPQLYGGGIRRVHAAEMLPFGALSLPPQLRSAPPATGDAIDAMLRSLSTAD